MNATTRSGHRGAPAAILAGAGGALALATWVSGEHGLAIGLIAFYLVVSVAALVWSGRDGDVAAILRAGGDERQQVIDRDATAITGLVLAGTAVIGAIVSQATGGIGQFGLMCFVGGTTYAVSLLVIRRRR